MPPKSTTKPKLSELLEAPKIVLAAPGSVTPSSPDARRWLARALAASSVALVAFRPYPGPEARPSAGALPAAASTFTVSNLNGTGPSSLRQAVINANNHPGPDIVNFQAGLAGTIPLTTQISISDSVQIIGPGPGVLALSGGNVSRIFYLKAASVFTTSISGLTLRDGNANGGGAIEDHGQPLILDNVHLISNTSIARGGAVNLASGDLLKGAFTLQDSLVSGNQAGTKGGGVALYQMTGGILVSNTQFISNSAEEEAGGAMWFYVSSAPTLIQASTFLSNSALYGGGALYLHKTGSVTIQNSTISENKADHGGGLSLHYVGDTTIQSTTISSNTTTAKQGGGVFLHDASGPVTIQDSTIRHNNAYTYGGGLAVLGITSGSVAIRRTTISDNGALRGGGLQLYQSSAPILLEDTTVSGNGALSGGGLYFGYNRDYDIAIKNSTIVSNSAASNGGGVLLAPNMYGSVALTNTIVANNSAINDPDLSNTDFFFQLSYDLVEVTGSAHITDVGGNIFGMDPLLGQLANNGGPTETHLPLPGSPAIDVGDPAFAPPPSTDQRGRPRVNGGQVDIGAVEVNSGSLQFSASNFQVGENAVHATITVTRTGGSEGAASVLYSTGGGTATPGSDYQAAAGTLNWADGDAAPKTFQVTILSDNLAEGNEVVGLSLLNAHGAALGSLSSATLTIIDAGAKLFLPLLRR